MRRSRWRVRGKQSKFFQERRFYRVWHTFFMWGWRWIIGNIVLEAGLIYALLSIVFGNIAPIIALASLVALYYAVSHFLLVRGFKAVRHEIEEEIAFGQQARCAHLDKLAQQRCEREKG